MKDSVRSAVAGNGTLSGEDQLVDIHGYGVDDLHCHRLLSLFILYSITGLWGFVNIFFAILLNLHPVHKFSGVDKGARRLQRGENHLE